jgi:hypothetical protein
LGFRIANKIHGLEHRTTETICNSSITGGKKSLGI